MNCLITVIFTDNLEIFVLFVISTISKVCYLSEEHRQIFSLNSRTSDHTIAETVVQELSNGCTVCYTKYSTSFT